MKRLFLLYLLILGFAANGAQYYVATNGSNATAGTIGAPWGTFRYGIQTMSEGDTLILRGGEHHDDGFQLTEFKNNIVIQNYFGETPTYRAVSFTDNMVRVNGKTNVLFSGIDFFGDIETSAVFKIDGGSQSITLTNCTIRGSHDGHGLLISSLVDGSENGNLVITHCNFITNGWAALPSDSQLHQIYMQNSSNIVEYCYIQGVTNVGGGTLGIHNFVSGGHDYIFRNNFITNCNIGIGLLSRQRDVAVYNNALAGNEVGISVYLSSNVFILNNTCVSNLSGIQVDFSTNVFVENNISVGGQSVNPGGIFLKSSAIDIFVRNNLAYNNAYSDYRDLGASSVTTNGNLFGITDISGVKSTNAVPYNARFVNAPIGDFSISAGSAAIGAGRTQSMFANDYAGITRGFVWDIGAWEHLKSGNAAANSATVGRITVR